MKLVKSTMSRNGRTLSSTVDYPMKHNFKPLRTPQFGADILQDRLWNKGTAFTRSERDRLGLRGLLPPGTRTIEEQAKKVLDHIDKKPNNEEKNLYLQDLHNRNETLYFKTLVDNIEQMAPLVYTPTGELLPDTHIHTHSNIFTYSLTFIHLQNSGSSLPSVW